MSDVLEQLETLISTHHRTAASISTAAAQEIARLRAEVESLRKDAERYRWLRGVDGDLWHDLGLTDPDGLDAALDAAKGGAA